MDATLLPLRPAPLSHAGDPHDHRRRDAGDVPRRARPDDRRDRAADDRARARQRRRPALGGDRLPRRRDRGRRRSTASSATSTGGASPCSSAIATFIVGSLACALAPNMLVLIVARAVQGLGGGGLISLAQTVDRRRHRAARARPLPGLFRRGVRLVQPRRPGARRLLRRASSLVGDLLDQPAARRSRLCDDEPRAEAAAAARAPASARRARRSADRRRRASA